LRALLRAAHEELPVHIENDFSKLIGEAFDGEPDSALRNDIREDSALLARNLAEEGKWAECWRVVRAAALTNTLARALEPDPGKQAELTLDLLMSLALIHGWAELTGEPQHLRRLTQYLERPWHELDRLAAFVAEDNFSTALAFPFVTGVKYQRWFQSLLLAASQLTPEYEFLGPQHIPIERGKIHASSLFHDWSAYRDYDEILKHLIGSAVALRHLERQRLSDTLRALLHKEVES
jgi:hypothetical protein